MVMCSACSLICATRWSISLGTECTPGSSSGCCTTYSSDSACSAKAKKDFVGKPLSAALQRAIEKRQGYIPADGEDLPLFDYGDAQAAAVYPIVAEGLIAGALLAVDSGDRPFEEADKKLLAAGVDAVIMTST